MKRCPHCCQEKVLEEFALDRRMNSGRQSWCRDCTKEKNRVANATMTSEQRETLNERRRAQYDPDRRRALRGDRVKAREFRSKLKLYNLTPEQYDEMWMRQGGLCAACGQPPNGQGNGGFRLHVDHDHSCCPTGGSCGRCVRGLVCWPCNIIMGLAHDDPERLGQIIAYLLKDAMLG